MEGERGTRRRRRAATLYRLVAGALDPGRDGRGDDLGCGLQGPVVVAGDGDEVQRGRVLQRRGQRTMELLRWGLVPDWASASQLMSGSPFWVSVALLSDRRTPERLRG